MQTRLCSRAWKEAKALSDAGAEVMLVELRESSPIMDYSIFGRHTNLPFDPDLLSILRDRPKILRAIASEVAEVRPDIVHTHNGPDCFGAWLPRRLDVPVVHDIHDIETASATHWPETARFHRLKGKTIDWMKRRWEHAASTRTGGVLTTSPAAARLIRARHGGRQVFALENKPFIGDHRLKPKLSATDGQIHLVYAGGITVADGSERDLLPVFRKMADDGLHVHLYLMTYNEAIRDAVERQAEANRRIHLHDPVPQDRFIEEVSQYDFGLIWFTNMNDNIRVTTQNKLYEFQVAGVPIITNLQEGYTADYIREKGCGLTVPGPDAVRQSIDSSDGFTLDPSDCFMDGRAILDIYMKVLSGRSGPTPASERGTSA